MLTYWKADQETSWLGGRVADGVFINLKPMSTLSEDVKGGSAELGMMAGKSDALGERKDETGA